MARTNTGSASNYFTSSLSYQWAIGSVRTVVLRFKTSSDTNQSLISNRDSSNRGWTVAFGSTNDTLQITSHGVATYNSSNSALAADGNWHSCVITRTAGGGLTFYVDSATAKGTASFDSYNSSTANVVVGANGPTTGSLNGSLADVALFSGVILNATDIAAYVAGAAPTALTSAGATLDHYWPLNNAAAGDESATVGGYTLTEVGSMGYEAATFGLSGSNIIRGVKGMTGGMQNLSGGTQ